MIDINEIKLICEIKALCEEKVVDNSFTSTEMYKINEVKYKGMGLSRASNFGVRVNRQTAITLMLEKINLDDDTFQIMCKEYGNDKDWVGLEKEDLDGLINGEWETFELDWD
jgi:hypothetical protein